VESRRSLFAPINVYVTVIAALAVVGAWMVVRGPKPASPWPLLVFAGLGMLAEHTAVELPGGLPVSPGLMLTMAAIVALGVQGAPLWGAFVGAAEGIWLPNLKRRRFQRVFFNVAQMFLAALVAAIVFERLDSTVPDLLAAVPAAAVYAVLNVGLTVVVVAMASGGSARRLLAGMRGVYVQSLPFGVIGVAFGRVYHDVSWLVAPLVAVPILIARQTFRSYLELRDAYDETIGILVGALEEKDRYTAGHADRVARYAHYIGEELGLSPARLERLRYAALLHDVGKLVVPNRLLNKPGRLTQEEFAIVRRHEEVSVELLNMIEFLRPVAPTASGEYSNYAHAGDERAIEPFIVAVADAYDAMTSTRSYRRALPQDVAYEELTRNAGLQFHPECVGALIAAIERRGERHGAGHEDAVEYFPVAPPAAGTGSAGLGDFDEGRDAHDGTEPAFERRAAAGSAW
jgi:hypothetical protein